VAASFGACLLLFLLKGVNAYIFRTGFVLVLLIGLFYPALGLASKTNQFKVSTWGLDGTRYLEAQNLDEFQAIQWLKNAPFGVVAEAVPSQGGSYTNYARVATMSGLPGVLGWMGHESQWRGGSEEMGTRQSDLSRLFCTRDPGEAQMILDQYEIKYVFLGSLERSTYTRGSPNCQEGLNEQLIRQLLNPVYQSGNVVIFSVPGR
jgi:uncharacterized membrane protein